jgi:hypothetical protein
MTKKQEYKYVLAAAIMTKSVEQIKFRPIWRIGTNKSLSISDIIGSLNNTNSVAQKVEKHCGMPAGLEKEVVI